MLLAVCIWIDICTCASNVAVLIYGVVFTPHVIRMISLWNWNLIICNTTQILYEVTSTKIESTIIKLQSTIFCWQYENWQYEVRYFCWEYDIVFYEVREWSPEYDWTKYDEVFIMMLKVPWKRRLGAKIPNSKIRVGFYYGNFFISTFLLSFYIEDEILFIYYLLFNSVTT